MKLLFIIFVVIFITGCVKIKHPETSLCGNCTDNSFEFRTFSNFDYSYKNLTNGSVVGYTYLYTDKYSYGNPFPNPNNKFEFGYWRITNTNGIQTAQELWAYNICTGASRQMCTNFFYGELSWSKYDWVIYTGYDHKIYKVKSNGDSLTALSTVGGYNRAGKWNPSGELYWNSRDNGTFLEDQNGLVVFQLPAIPFAPFDWINDSVLIGCNTTQVCSLNILSNELTPLSAPINNISLGIYIYNKGDNSCYISHLPSLTYFKYLLKCSLDGTQTVDTISKMYKSYEYKGGFILNDKLVTGLQRSDWYDSINSQIEERDHIIYMDLDATGERMFNIPE